MKIYILTKNNEENGYKYYEISRFIETTQAENMTIEEWGYLDECETPERAEELAQKYAEKYGCEWEWE